MEQTKSTRLIVGITGATGTIFGVRILQMLHGSGVETQFDIHLDVMNLWDGVLLDRKRSATETE